MALQNPVETHLKEFQNYKHANSHEGHWGEMVNKSFTIPSNLMELKDTKKQNQTLVLFHKILCLEKV
jgi:hypothetical protein